MFLSKYHNFSQNLCQLSHKLTARKAKYLPTRKQHDGQGTTEIPKSYSNLAFYVQFSISTCPMPRILPGCSLVPGNSPVLMCERSFLVAPWYLVTQLC